MLRFLSLLVSATLQEKPRTQAGRGTPIPDESPKEDPPELITIPTAQPVETMTDEAAIPTPQPLETSDTVIINPTAQPTETVVVVIMTPKAQPVETVDDAAMALRSLQLEDNSMEMSETASGSLSPDSSPVGGASQKVRSSSDKAEPSENTQSGSLSTGSSSDKEVGALDWCLPVFLPSGNAFCLCQRILGHVVAMHNQAVEDIGQACWASPSPALHELRVVS